MAASAWALSSQGACRRRPLHVLEHLPHCYVPFSRCCSQIDGGKRPCRCMRRRFRWSPARGRGPDGNWNLVGPVSRYARGTRAPRTAPPTSAVNVGVTSPARSANGAPSSTNLPVHETISKCTVQLSEMFSVSLKLNCSRNVQNLVLNGQ
jgi:hypothetical protein